MRTSFGLVVTGLVACLTALASPSAQGDGVPETTPVTVYCKDIGLRAALRLIFEPRNLEYLVRHDVPDMPLTINFERVSMLAALRATLAEGWFEAPGLTQWRGGDVFQIGVRKLPSNAVAEAPLTVRMEKTPLREAIRMICSDGKLTFAVDPAIPDVAVSLDVRDTSRRSVIYAMLRQVAAEVPNVYAKISVGRTPCLCIELLHQVTPVEAR